MRRTGTLLPMALLLALLLVQAAMAADVPADQPECATRSLVQDAELIAARGVENGGRAGDGSLVPDGWTAVSPAATTLSGPGAFLAWDLGASYPVSAVAIQADAGHAFGILGSTDGEQWHQVWTAPAVAGEGLLERGQAGFTGEARFLRLDIAAGEGPGYVSELRAFCAASQPFPPPAERHAPLAPAPERVLERQLLSGKLVVALAGWLLLAAGWKRLSPAGRRRLAWVVIAASAGAWLHFGRFAGAEGLHVHDAFHYYMGSKYAPELGYFELYRCLARAEREAGRGAVLEDVLARNLDDYRVHRGAWLRSPDGACRAEFTPERWREFRRDVDTFRPWLGDGFVRQVLFDHGYNATPVNTAWLRLWTTHLPLSVAGLRALSWIDFLQLALSVAATWWGFGPRAAAVLALLLGCGAPWDYQWIGGSLLRFTWLACLCGGLACLGRRRWSLGMALLAAASLLRLFPLAFLGTVVLWMAARAWRRRHLDRVHERALLVAGGTIAVGLLVGLSVGGVRFYAEFARDMALHEGAPSVNELGLPYLLAAQPGRMLGDLTRPALADPHELWTQVHTQSVREQAPVRWAAVAGSAGLLVLLAVRGAPLFWCLAATMPLVFSLVEMSSYDYVWLAVLVPLCRSRTRMIVALLAFVALTAAARVWLAVEMEHVVGSLGAALLAVAVVADLWLRLAHRAPARRSVKEEPSP